MTRDRILALMKNSRNEEWDSHKVARILGISREIATKHLGLIFKQDQIYGYNRIIRKDKGRKFSCVLPRMIYKYKEKK